MGRAILNSHVMDCNNHNNFLPIKLLKTFDIINFVKKNSECCS